MAYEMVQELGEMVTTRVELRLSSKAQPFYFAVSNRAIYIPRVKLIAKSDPYHFERVPLNQLQKVAVQRLRPFALWLLASLMIPAGLFTTLFMMEPLLKNVPGTYHVSGWPFAILVGGMLIPFAAKGRFGLEVRFQGGKYLWKPPLVVDKASREKVADTLQTLVNAMQGVGVQVSDERTRR